MENITSNTTIAVIMVCLACHEEENWWSKTQMVRISFMGRAFPRLGTRIPTCPSKITRAHRKPPIIRQ